MKRLITELKRRNVIRIAGIYAVVAWILMQVAGTLESSLRLPEWFDSVVTAGLIIGFPIALLLAWAFEMTPEGVKRTEDLAEGETVTSSKMDGLILLGIVVVIGLGIWQQINNKKIDSRLDEKDTITSNIPEQQKVSQTEIPKKEATIQANSIAVLPFTDLSPNKDQEYFSDGMAEEILNVLVRVNALKVTSRTSAFQFKGQEIGIPAIAKQLKVRHILEGSVRKAGDNLRITAQLIDTQNDNHLWSNTFDRPLTTDNIFAIQDEISNAIVEALKNRLGLDVTESIDIKQSTENLSAYELYLKARPMYQARVQLDKADELLKQAIELDPSFAQAWAMRAALQVLMVDYGFSDKLYKEMAENGLGFANKALKLDKNNALAFAAQASIKFNLNIRLIKQYDLAESIEGYKKALKFEPHDPSTLNWIGIAYRFVGFQQESMKYYNSCIEYAPRYAPCVINAIWANDMIGNYDKAVKQYTKNLSNGVIGLSSAPFKSLFETNQKLAFISALTSPELFNDWSRTGELYQAYQNPQLDHSELTKAAYEYLSKKAKVLGYWEPVLAPLDFENPTDNLHVGLFRVHYKTLNTIKIKSYIKKAGVYDYWQKYGYPPQCRPIGENDFECEVPSVRKL